MVISKINGVIESFQWMDPQIGVEFGTTCPRVHYFPFMPENVPDGKIDLAKWKGKKIKITVETVDDDNKTSEAPEV